MTSLESVLITGANAGLGKEAARQLASTPTMRKIYLACRNEEKARAAQAELEKQTGRSIFEIVLLDTMNLNSVRQAVTTLSTSVDAVILNAGGVGGKTPDALTPEGATHIFAVNLLGHAALVSGMLERNRINTVVLYAGSEVARGIPTMGIAPPTFDDFSEDEFASIADGSKFDDKTDPMLKYAMIKFMAAQWMASLSRLHPHLRFITMSPGGTTGTNGMDDMPFLQRLFFKHIGGVLMLLFGMMHSLEKGARRYVDGVTNPERASGRFYASKSKSPTGPVVDQSELYPHFDDPEIQNNARLAIERFLHASSTSETVNAQEVA